MHPLACNLESCLLYTSMQSPKRFSPFSKKKSCTAGTIRQKRIWWEESPVLWASTIQKGLIPPCNIKLRNRLSRITGSKKRNPQEYENSGFGFNSFSFLHCDFPIFAFGCPISTKGEQPRTWLESSVSGIEKEAGIWMSHFWVPNFDLCSLTKKIPAWNTG